MAVATVIPALLLALMVEMAVMIPSVSTGEDIGDYEAGLLDWHRRTVPALFAFAANGRGGLADRSCGRHVNQ
jgi:hypothetical protein